MGKRSKVATRLVLGLWILPIAGGAVNTVFHARFGLCMSGLMRFERGEAVPVLYGHVTDFHGAVMEPAAERVGKGEAVLGGCVPHLWSHVCPHCHWPTRFDSPHGG